MRQQLGKELSSAEQGELARQLAGLSRSASIQDLLAAQLVNDSGKPRGRRLALQAMAQSGLRQTPDTWIAGLAKVLDNGGDDDVVAALSAARSLPIQKTQAGKLTTALLRLAGDSIEKPEIRLSALAAVPGGLTAVTDSQFDLSCSCLKKDHPVSSRLLAADVLARARLNNEQLLALTEQFKAIGPMEAERLVEAFAQCSDEKVGKELASCLKTAPALAGMRADTLKRAFGKFGSGLQPEVEELCSRLNQDARQQKEKLDKLLAGLKEGDIRRGQAVFNSPKAACATCHAIGYQGGTVGPDLTRVGQVRGERDILESIVFPSASFVQGYQPVVVYLKSGKQYNGLVRKDTPDEILLILNATEQVRIRKEDIESMEPSKVSIMPAGLDQQLSSQELADLLAFLRACR
jgi:putative heme-binding domain-containing protein